MAMAKLKALGDKIVIPDTQTMYARKTSEIASAKADLAKVVAQLVAAEKLPNSQRRGYSELLAKRASLKAKVERLSGEAGLLKAELIAARPKPKLTAWQQLFADAANHDPYANFKRGTREQIAEAKAALDAALLEYKLRDGSRDALAKLNDARLKLAVLEGQPYSARALRLFSPETLADAAKKEFHK
jgi:hypothetical protein